jgi:hypothetical protein
VDHLLFSRSDLLSVYADMSTCCRVRPAPHCQMLAEAKAWPPGRRAFSGTNLAAQASIQFDGLMIFLVVRFS